MARLVLLSEGYTGRTFDIKVEQTTVGRTSDNAIEIPDGSVSSHHGEFLLRGQEVLFRDLGSTNGSWLGNDKISEVTLKHGQVLRLGQIEMRFESEPPAGKAGAKHSTHTAVIPGGINREQLSNPGTSGPGKTSEFKKKSNNSTTVFLIVIGVVVVLLIGLMAMLVMK